MNRWISCRAMMEALAQVNQVTLPDLVLTR
jgi:hypothetical protein